MGNNPIVTNATISDQGHVCLASPVNPPLMMVRWQTILTWLANCLWRITTRTAINSGQRRIGFFPSITVDVVSQMYSVWIHAARKATTTLISDIRLLAMIVEQHDLYLYTRQ